MTTRLRGRRFVLVLYAALVAFATFAGAAFAVVVDDPLPPRFLFVVPFPPTLVGFALYGGLTVALVLGVPLLLVRYVSRYDDAALEE